MYSITYYVWGCVYISIKVHLLPVIQVPASYHSFAAKLTHPLLEETFVSLSSDCDVESKWQAWTWTWVGPGWECSPPSTPECEVGHGAP